MAIEIPRPRWPGDPRPGQPRESYPTTGGLRAVRPEIYGVMPVAQVESELRNDKMPAPFVRRMRVINLLSALTLRKIEDNMIAPFEVMDIHHVLNEQISQDAIIAMMENKNVATALETGNLHPLWIESKDKPLLRKGFEQGWIQRFNKTPFDPICVMLAMRAKLMLDAVDELGHSYDLLKSIGLGWIDFGEIEGEEAGDPDTYIPPAVDSPIEYPDAPPDQAPSDTVTIPVPGEPGYIPPADLSPTDPGYTTEPGSPGYIPPGEMTPTDPGYTTEPGSPGYIPPGEIVPGEPGYVPGPGDQGFIPPPGYEAVVPGHPDYVPGPGEPGYVYPPSPGGGFYGGNYSPGGSGRIGGPGGTGGVGPGGGAPWGFSPGPGGLGGHAHLGGPSFGNGINCCLDKDDPEAYVTIGYFTSSINAGDTLGLTVEQAHEDCDGENYEWIEVNGVGELSAETGLDVIYTAPTSGANCPGNAEIQLICGGEVVDTLAVTINYDYAIAFVYGDPELEINQNDSLIVNVTANGTPLTWAVTGTGFSLEHAETAGTGNVLHADETACGAATITITDCDGNIAIGFVRCTVGQWVWKSNNCTMPGEGSLEIFGSKDIRITKIQGNKKQISVYDWLSKGSIWYESCDEAIGAMCCYTLDCGTIDLPCATMFPGGYSVKCAQAVCRYPDCQRDGDVYRVVTARYSIDVLNYYEWEC